MKLTKIESYEIQAFAFRVMTGYMAPGNDSSPLADEAPYEERCAAWDEWRNEHAPCILAMLHGFEALIDRDDGTIAECEALLLAAGVMPEANESLRAELSAYREDAERYRWLRNRIPGSAYRIAGIIYSEGGVGVDAGIDKARKGEGEA